MADAGDLKFERQLLQQDIGVAMPKGYREVLWLWLAYFIQAENFDRQHPGAWLSRTVWIPRGDVLNQCRKHAQQLRMATIVQANDLMRRLRLMPDDLSRAEQAAAKLCHPERVDLANQLQVEINCERITEAWEVVKAFPEFK